MSLRWAALLAAFVVALDQATKALVIAALPFGGERDVIPGFFRLVHSRNRGIAFGLFGSSGPAVQIALLCVVIVVVVVVAVQLRRTGQDGLNTLGLSLVLGGALGNLIDRLVRGEVVDFLDFFVRLGDREHHWPAFNVADAAISVGAGCVILAELLRTTRRTHASDPL